MDIVEDVLAPRDGDVDGDEEAGTIGVACVVDEVAADRSAAFGDEVANISADGATAAAGPNRIGSGRRRTPPALMLTLTLLITRSIPACMPENIERDEKGCWVNLKDPKQIESCRSDEVGADEDDADADAAGVIGTADAMP
jgi:hypothetical protein